MTPDLEVMREELKGLGLPIPLLGIAEGIFKDLPAIERRAFIDALLDGGGTAGRDLSRVHWAFLAAELRALPPTKGEVKTSIERVIEGMDLLVSGQSWPDAEAAAASREAWAAAEAAAEAAKAWAAEAEAAASGAARIRQRDTLLRLIAEAAVSGVK